MALSTEYQQLRDLLLAPEVSSLHLLGRDLNDLQRRINDPEQFALMLKPVIAEIVQRGDPLINLAILRAITPLLDQAVKENVGGNFAPMADAFAPASTAAIARHFADAPGSAARDLAPLMSAAIKEQIRGQREAMIDALYPLIGSTISKYLSETLTTLVERINERIESHLSFSAMRRKLRSWVTGVSEAEILIRQSLPAHIDAAFLIHSSSGLIIAQAQRSEAPLLDPHLLSGMLTAIRSLFNDSMASGRGDRELDQIEYGESKIVLEAAGFSYLAAVIRGIPDAAFRRRLRATVASIVQLPGNSLGDFSGDAAEVPVSITRAVQELVDRSAQAPQKSGRRKPYAALAAAGIVVLAIAIPFGVHLSRNVADRDTSRSLAAALHSAAPGIFNGVTVEADRGTLHLSGLVPNEFQRGRVESLLRSAAPTMTIDNHLTAVVSPPFAVQISRQTDAIVSALNTLDGVYLIPRYHNGDLEIAGMVADSSLRDSVLGAFETLPGLRTLSNRIAVSQMEIPERLLFDLNSAAIGPDQRAVLTTVQRILAQVPGSHLQITGHSDMVGGESVNKRIAYRRAASVQAALLHAGIPAARLHIGGTPGPPPGNIPPDSDKQSRCVRFTLMRSRSPAHE
jgi:lysophospholipase L1-like esterase